MIKNITKTTEKKSSATELLNTTETVKSNENINEYYISVGKTLANKMEKCDNPLNKYVLNAQPNTTLNTVVFLNTDESEVKRMILDLKNVCTVE